MCGCKHLTQVCSDIEGKKRGGTSLAFKTHKPPLPLQSRSQNAMPGRSVWVFPILISHSLSVVDFL